MIATAATQLPGLTAEELRRYARHLTLPEVGLEGQRRLKGARVLLVGVGGLGSPAALYLAAAGVGTLGLVDFDLVSESNLQRQVLFGVKDAGSRKLEAGSRRLNDLNPNVQLVSHEGRLTSKNALEIFADYDVIVDGSDNFPTRYLVNDACALLGKPDVYGAIHRFEGQVSVFWADRGPCYRCLYRDPPPPELVPSCEQAGVLGVLPGIVGTLQAAEVIKLLLGAGQSLAGRLLLVDALTMRFREMELSKDPDCPMCGPQRTIDALIDYDAFCLGEAAMEVTVFDLRDKLAAKQPVVILDVRQPWEVEIGAIEGSRFIPLHELPGRLAELDQQAEIITVCHRGGRATQATRFLQANGFAGARTLTGGIDAWSVEIDPAVERY